MSDGLFPAAASAHRNSSTNLGVIVSGFPNKPRSRGQPAALPDRDPKRVKLHPIFKDIPPIQNGVISASKTPIFDEGRRVDIQMEEVTDDEAGLFFFGDPNTDLSNIPTYEMPSYVKSALKSRWASEEKLRNAVYSDLLFNHGIEFPNSNKKEEPGVVERALRRATGMKTKRYQESDLASLMTEYGRELAHENANMKRIMRGLPVTTTTSKPDLAPLDPREGSTQIRFGEFKNASNCTASSARSQCVMYLLALLYWLRTELGKPVESVYGFYFCGRRCEDQHGTYCIGLIKLSAPLLLGEKLRADYCEYTDEMDNDTPMRVLIHFLKHGKRWSISSRNLGMGDGSMEEYRRIPSLFTLPTNLWEDDGVDRQLILHGTLSIVLLVSAKGLKDLLMDESPHFKNFRAGLYWQGWCQAVSSLPDDGSKFYLKIRTKDTSLHQYPMGPMCDVWDVISANAPFKSSDHEIACRSIKGIYPTKPYSTPEFGVALMNDCGRPLSPTVIENMTDVLPKFKKIVSIARFLSELLPHGDVLPHNMVYNEDTTVPELSLIDLDEGMKKGSSLFTRKNEYVDAETNENWYAALRYPNFFRADAKRYTNVQLLASFLYIVGEGSDLAIGKRANYLALQEGVKELGEALWRLEVEKKLQRTPSRMKKFGSWVDQLYETMMQIVEG